MRILVFLICAMLATTASAETKKIRVVASFSIVEDIAKSMGGEYVEVTSLVSRNKDPHSFVPLAVDVKKIKSADIIIINGLGFEPWLPRLLEASKTKAKVIEATATIVPIATRTHGHDHDHGTYDPHAWHSLVNAEIYARNISSAFMAYDPGHAQYYNERLKGYLIHLKRLRNWAAVQFHTIPKEKRRIAVTHDTFAYFAKEWDFTIISAQGSGDSETSAKSVADIITNVRSHSIQALFTENTGTDLLMEQIARETGIKMGGKLYTDALSELSGEAGTYLEMMDYNIRKFLEALSEKK